MPAVLHEEDKLVDESNSQRLTDEGTTEREQHQEKHVEDAEVWKGKWEGRGWAEKQTKERFEADKVSAEERSRQEEQNRQNKAEFASDSKTLVPPALLAPPPHRHRWGNPLSLNAPFRHRWGIRSLKDEVDVQTQNRKCHHFSMPSTPRQNISRRLSNMPRLRTTCSLYQDEFGDGSLTGEMQGLALRYKYAQNL